MRSFLFLFPFLRLLLLERHEAKDDDNVYVVDPRRVFRSDRILVDVWLGHVWVPDYAPLCIQLPTIVYLSIRPYALPSDDPALSERSAGCRHLETIFDGQGRCGQKADAGERLERLGHAY